MQEVRAKSGGGFNGRIFQLEDLKVYEPLNPMKLTRTQKKAALRAINLIKEKRCGRLKGRTVADGRTQKGMYDKIETATPTVGTDSLMMSIIIDMFEGRDVATADIAGAYLKAYMKDYTIIKFMGPSVDILCSMKPIYTNYITMENDVKVIYVRLVKAIYGCVQSALLWYKIGFELNPYDPCVANKVINGKQCTIAWYLDDMKISHADSEVVTDIIEQIKQRFGKMTVARGDEHVFLGMHIKYVKRNGTAEIMMRTYLEESIAEPGHNITRTAVTPAKRDLFDVDKTAAPFDKQAGEPFHSVTAKLLYVSLRARRDLFEFSLYARRVQKHDPRPGEAEETSQIHQRNASLQVRARCR